MNTVICEADHLETHEVDEWSAQKVLEEIQAKQEVVAKAILQETLPHGQG
jgi:N-acetylmuramic acid 6-phosphate (MurNAc-6-P) etherase